MDQFVPADWTWSTNKGDAFAPSCAQDEGLVELLGCNSHVVIQSQPPPPPVREHEAAPWFQYSAFVHDDGPPHLLGDLLPNAGRVAGLDTAGDNASPCPRGGKASGAMSYHDASTRPRASGADGRSSTGKRKQRDVTGSPSEVMRDVESESAAVTKCEPSTGKRRRAAQVHNLSERRRRDRINEKMRALQQLVPHCNKTDKASMLDEAIEYLKSLQLQVQMMWTTGGSMAPAPAPAPAMFLASDAHSYMQRMASTRSRMPPFGDFRIH